LPNGNFSRLTVGITFARSVGSYQLHVFVPSFAIIVCVYVSMFLHPKAPMRSVIMLMAIAAQASIMEGVYDELPKISYLTAMDYFFGMHLLMLLIAFAGE